MLSWSVRETIGLRPRRKIWSRSRARAEAGVRGGVHQARVKSTSAQKVAMSWETTGTNFRYRGRNHRHSSEWRVWPCRQTPRRKPPGIAGLRQRKWGCCMHLQGAMGSVTVRRQNGFGLGKTLSNQNVWGQGPGAGGRRRGRSVLRGSVRRRGHEFQDGLEFLDLGFGVWRGAEKSGIHFLLLEGGEEFVSLGILGTGEDQGRSFEVFGEGDGGVGGPGGEIGEGVVSDD